MASASPNNRFQVGFAPRDGSGLGGLAGAGQGSASEAPGAGIGGVRMAAGPPTAPVADSDGLALGGSGRWEREKDVRTPDKRKVCASVGVTLPCGMHWPASMFPGGGRGWMVIVLEPRLPWISSCETMSGRIIQGVVHITGGYSGPRSPPRG